MVVYAVVIAIAVPLAWVGGTTYSRHRTESTLEIEISYLEMMIKEVYFYPNQSRMVEVDFPSGLGARIEWIEIGGAEDDPWSKLSTVRYKFAGEGVISYIISEPNIPVTGDGYIPLQLSSGTHTLYIESLEDPSFRNGARAVRISKT